MISRKKPSNSSKLWLKHEKWSQEKIHQINFSWHHFKKETELKIISEGCSYALVIKGHNRAAQILVFLTALLNCFLSSLVELNYQSTNRVFKPGNDLPVFYMNESRGCSDFCKNHSWRPCWIVFSVLWLSWTINQPVEFLNRQWFAT